MSVIIKGMEMPRRCVDCVFLNLEFFPSRCGFTLKERPAKKDDRLSDCPLEEVKEPSEQEKEIEELEKRLIELLTGKTTIEEAVKVKPRRARRGGKE